MLTKFHPPSRGALALLSITNISLINISDMRPIFMQARITIDLNARVMFDHRFSILKKNLSTSVRAPNTDHFAFWSKRNVRT